MRNMFHTEFGVRQLGEHNISESGHIEKLYYMYVVHVLFLPRIQATLKIFFSSTAV